MVEDQLNYRPERRHRVIQMQGEKVLGEIVSILTVDKLPSVLTVFQRQGWFWELVYVCATYAVAVRCTEAQACVPASSMWMSWLWLTIKILSDADPVPRLKCHKFNRKLIGYVVWVQWGSFHQYVCQSLTTRYRQPVICSECYGRALLIRSHILQ